jgi:RHS repeat-associated protein
MTGGLFAYELYYEQAPQSSDIAPQFNGNISGVSWHTQNNGEHYYGFTYDGVNRLLGTRYAVGGAQLATGSWGNAFTEQLTYDKNGNIRTLQRYGANGLIDDMVYSYNGNRLSHIVNQITGGGGFHSGATSYTYDANGNTVQEGSTSIAYNLLNLPAVVDLVGGRKITTSYAADGRKLQTIAVDQRNQYSAGSKKYNGNLVFDNNGDLAYILFPEGRILYNPTTTDYTFEYHLRDHLGSVRVAFEPTANGNTVTQENAYYPFGAPVATLSWSAVSNSPNRYLREGKEYIDDFWWNKYDYGWRAFCSLTGRSLQRDPHAAMYSNVSAYALWNNNPLSNIDPNGMDWYSFQESYLDEYGEEQWRTRYMYYNGVMSKEDMIAGGYTHVGETISVLRKDGSYDNYYQNISIHSEHAFDAKEYILSNGLAGLFVGTNSTLDEYAKLDLMIAARDRGVADFYNHPATQIGMALTAFPDIVGGIMSLGRLAANLFTRMAAKGGGQTVYRAVNAAEKASINSSKNFLLKEGGTEVKYFAKTFQDAHWYGSRLYPEGYSVIRGTINPSVSIGSYWYPYVDIGAYAFPGNFLPYIKPIFP